MKRSVWDLFDLFYDYDKVISFVAHVSTSTAVYLWEMQLFHRQCALKCNLSKDFSLTDKWTCLTRPFLRLYNDGCISPSLFDLGQNQHCSYKLQIM